MDWMWSDWFSTAWRSVLIVWILLWWMRDRPSNAPVCTGDIRVATGLILIELSFFLWPNGVTSR